MSAAILPHCLKTKAQYNDECSHSSSLSENKGTLQWWVQPFSLIVWKQRNITVMSAAILPHCLKTKAHYNDECSHSPSLSENKSTVQLWVQPFSLIVWNKSTVQWWVQPFSLIVWKQKHSTMMSAAILPNCLKTKAQNNDECILFSLIVWRQRHITMTSAAILPHCLKTKAQNNDECILFSLIVWKQRHITMMSAATLPHCLKTKAHYNDECSHSPSLSENKSTVQLWVQPFSLIVWKQNHSTMMSAAILHHCLKTKAQYNDECSHSSSFSENKDTLQWWVQPFVLIFWKKGTLQWWVQPFSLIVWKQRHITMMNAAILPHCLKTKAH